MPKRNHSLYGTDFSNLSYRLAGAVQQGDDQAMLEAARQFGAYYNIAQEEARGYATKPNEEELAKLLADGVNAMGFDHDAFHAALRYEHRTIQQSIMRLFVEYVRRVADRPDNEVDGRNHASVEVARSLVHADRDGFINLALPLV